MGAPSCPRAPPALHRGATARGHALTLLRADTGALELQVDSAPRDDERFDRDAADQRGSGLGLFIAEATVEAHHGRMWIDSRPGVGTMVTFAIPLAGPPPQLAH